MSTRRDLLLAALVFCAAARPIRAATIFSNGGPNLLGGSEATAWVEAEDFVLAADAVLTGGHFWTLETPDGTPWDGTLDYYLFLHETGHPASTPFATGSGANIVRTPTGRVISGDVEIEYAFDFATPISLSGSTTYWLGLHLAATFARNDIYWEYAGSGFGSDGLASLGGPSGIWTHTQQDHAFSLTGILVPEPPSLMLALWASIGCILVAGRTASTACSRRRQAFKPCSIAECLAENLSISAQPRNHGHFLADG
jgi:hypothetical protein